MSRSLLLSAAAAAALALIGLGASHAARAQSVASCPSATAGTVWPAKSWLPCKTAVTYVAQPIPLTTIMNDMRCPTSGACVFSWLVASSVLPTDQVWTTTSAQTTGKWLYASQLSFVTTPPPVVRNPSPRCLPGDYSANFHTELDAAGDTIGVLWCDDAQGIGVNVLGVNLSGSVAASSCLSSLQTFQWSVAWEQAAWNACVTTNPTPAQSATAQAFAAKWVPHLTTVGGPMLPSGAVAAGIQCGLTRMLGSAARYYNVNNGYALCAITYPPSTGW